MNPSLSPLVNLFLDDKNIVLYRPQVNRILKFAEATILLSQTIYWWKKSNFKPFYKFKEPCKHQDYTVGDSWTEELGFTRYSFDKAIDILTKDFQLVHVEQNRLEHKTYYEVDSNNLTTFLEVAYNQENLPKVDRQLSGKSTVNSPENLPSAFDESRPSAFDNSTETTRDNKAEIDEEKFLTGIATGGNDKLVEMYKKMVNKKKVD